jgi:putative restriction endonuclease
MDTLQRALVEKAGNDNGFEYVLPTASAAVELGSARHKARVAIEQAADGGFRVSLIAGSALLAGELARSFPTLPRADGAFCVDAIGSLARLLRRAAALAQALPNQVAIDYATNVQKAFAELSPDLIKHTEVQAIVRQRVGQQAFREAMLDYWGGACAVTGIAVPAVLRASHAKPWAESESDAERLDVFNGFLLCANLDALFDRFLISFDAGGEMLVSGAIAEGDRMRLGLHERLRLRWIAADHEPYLQIHRARFASVAQGEASPDGQST